MTAFHHAAPHQQVSLGAAHDWNARRTCWVPGRTAAMMVGDAVVGRLFNSVALVADGVHMATHAGVLAIGAAAYPFARRHAADPRSSFGTGKVSHLPGFDLGADSGRGGVRDRGGGTDGAARVPGCAEATGDARITNLHFRQVGPGAHAAIVRAVGTVHAGMVRACRLRCMGGRI